MGGSLCWRRKMKNGNLAGLNSHSLLLLRNLGRLVGGQVTDETKSNRISGASRFAFTAIILDVVKIIIVVRHRHIVLFFPLRIPPLLLHLIILPPLIILLLHIAIRLLPALLFSLPIFRFCSASTSGVVFQHVTLPAPNRRSTSKRRGARPLPP